MNMIDDPNFPFGVAAFAQVKQVAVADYKRISYLEANGYLGRDSSLLQSHQLKTNYWGALLLMQVIKGRLEARFYIRLQLSPSSSWN
jgi:hypothetical protein